MSVKLCVCCKHCNFNEGYYSELTWYEDNDISCWHNPAYQSTDSIFASQKAFALFNTYAERCEHYMPAE